VTDLEELGRVQKRLRSLSKRLRGSDAVLLEQAIEQLEYLEFVQDDIEDLADALEIVDEEHRQGALAFPNQIALIELSSSIRALREIEAFLTVRARSDSIGRLEEALIQLWGGSRVGMFELQGQKGRPRDVPTIQTVKGILAGLMHVKQATGMSRGKAAKWITDNISPALASRIARKPITARSVIEWLDRYGGNHPPDSPGGRAFKTWKNFDSKLTEVKLQEMTERMARTFPARS